MSQIHFLGMGQPAAAQSLLPVDPDNSPNGTVPMQVLCGWDDQLKYYFVVVETYVPFYPELEHTLFDNLHRMDAAMTIEQVLAVLAGFKIPGPPDLGDRLASRGRQDGPVFTTWTGEVTPRKLLKPQDVTREPWRLPAGLQWSGRKPIPIVNSRVRIHKDSFGPGSVEGYFHEGGRLGVQIRPDVMPHWYCPGWKSAKPLPRVYGADLDRSEATSLR